MKVYRIEAILVATFYVKADSPNEAKAKAKEYAGLEAPEISGLGFDSQGLPEVSISPAMTVLWIIPGEPEDMTDHVQPSTDHC